MVLDKKELNVIDHILENMNIQSTLFPTANFAINIPIQIKELSKSHKIASHTFFHSSFKHDDLKDSLYGLENITLKKFMA
jgi:hypothetical protein